MFNVIHLTQLISEETKAEEPQLFSGNPSARLAFSSALTSYSSNNLDYLLCHHDVYPVSSVLFYASETFERQVMEIFGSKLFQSFCARFDRYFKQGTYSLPKPEIREFNSECMLIVESVLIDYIRTLYMELCSQNIIAPWIYLAYNKDFDSAFIKQQKKDEPKKSQPSSNN